MAMPHDLSYQEEHAVDTDSLVPVILEANRYMLVIGILREDCFINSGAAARPRVSDVDAPSVAEIAFTRLSPNPSWSETTKTPPAHPTPLRMTLPPHRQRAGSGPALERAREAGRLGEAQP